MVVLCAILSVHVGIVLVNGDSEPVVAVLCWGAAGVDEFHVDLMCPLLLLVVQPEERLYIRDGGAWRERVGYIGPNWWSGGGSRGP